MELTLKPVVWSRIRSQSYGPKDLQLVTPRQLAVAGEKGLLPDWLVIGCWRLHRWNQKPPSDCFGRYQTAVAAVWMEDAELSANNFFLYTWTVSIYSFKVSLSESLLIADELASLLQPMWDCGNLNLTKAVKKRYAQRVNKECGNSVVTYAEEPTFAGVDYLLSIRFEVQNRSVLWSAPFLEDFSNLAELLLQQLLCCTSCVLGSICIFYKDSANCNFTKIKLCRQYNCPCLWHNFL